MFKIIILIIRWYHNFYFNYKTWYIKLTRKIIVCCMHTFLLCCSLSFLIPQNSSLYNFHCVWSTPFRQYLRISQVETDSLGFPLFESILISFSFLKDSFAGYRMYSSQFFFLIPQKTLYHLFLALMVSDKKYFAIQIDVPLYVIHGIVWMLSVLLFFFL